MVILGEFLSLFSCLPFAFVVSLTGSHFLKFAGGAPTISEEDFARVLLRHTTWDMDPVFQRLKRKEKPETVSLRKKMWRIQLQLLTAVYFATKLSVYSRKAHIVIIVFLFRGSASTNSVIFASCSIYSMILRSP